MVQSSLLIILIYYLVTTLDNFLLGWDTLVRPIVVAPLTGLVLGDLKTGVIMGASLESIFMGISAIGGSIAADPTTSSVIAVAYAILMGANVETALALALPIGTIMVGFRDVLMPVFSAMAPYWERLAVKNLKKFTRQTIACSLTLYQLVPCLILYVCVNYGFEFFGDPTSGGGGSDPWLIVGLTAGTYMLIAVGFAILASMIISKETVLFFFVGFIFAKFLGLDTIVIAVLGIAIAIAMFFGEKRIIDLKNSFSDSGGSQKKRLFSEKIDLSGKEKKILNSMFWRSHMTFVTFNMVKMEANAFTITMAPAIEEIYRDDEEGRKEAILRHQNFFNTHVIPFNFIAGLSYAMEKEHKEKNSIDGATINNLKAALMGPTAGMFDSLFFNCFRVITAGIAIGLCSQGNVLGMILFVLLYGLPHSIIKYYFTYWGYTLGTSFIDSVFGSGLIDALKKAASVLGLLMIGAMTAQMVYVPLNFVVTVNQASVNIGEILDSIFPGILSICLLFTLVWLIKKGLRPTWLVLLVLGFGMVGALIGIF